MNYSQRVIKRAVDFSFLSLVNELKFKVSPSQHPEQPGRPDGRDRGRRDRLRGQHRSLFLQRHDHLGELLQENTHTHTLPVSHRHLPSALYASQPYCKLLVSHPQPISRSHTHTHTWHFFYFLLSVIAQDLMRTFSDPVRLSCPSTAVGQPWRGRRSGQRSPGRSVLPPEHTTHISNTLLKKLFLFHFLLYFLTFFFSFSQAIL